MLLHSYPESWPDATDLLMMVLKACSTVGIGGSDKTGRTLFDIQEKVPLSCLSAGKPVIAKARNIKLALIPSTDSGPGPDGRSLGGFNERVARYTVGSNPSFDRVPDEYGDADRGGMQFEKNISKPILQESS